MPQDDSLFISDMILKDDKENITSLEDASRELSELDIRIKHLSMELEDLIQHRNHIASLITEMQENTMIPPIKQDNAKIHQEDSAEDKASFMLDLFNPRKDIFATRERNKDGNIVYYPRCKNLWQDGCYRKNKDKNSLPCKDCPMNEKMGLIPDIIINGNFRNTSEYGKGAIGIYPLKPGNITRFVAIDLDEEDWKEAAKSILITARQLGIAMSVERSFSGNGAHLWTFFSEDIPAIEARKLAILLIDKTREYNSSLSMKSYDRLFPSQDALSEKGYGNLILLPLVASAVNRGCTLFLDDEFNPYPLKEQIPYLSSLHRHSASEIQAFIRSMEKEEFRLSNLSEEQMNPSWNKWIPRISNEDIIQPLIIYRSTGLSFDKKALSPKAQETLRRIGTISNPLYYKELMKRDGHYTGIDSSIPLFEENSRVLKLPRGLYGIITGLFDSLKIQYIIEDHRISKTNLTATFTKKLKPYQEEAVDRTRKADCGIIAAPTGSGKTIMALAIIAEKKERTLIIVNSKALLEQWQQAIEESLIIETKPDQEISTRNHKTNYSPIGTLEGSKGNRMKGIIDIAMLQSLSSRIDDGESIVSKYGLIIVDECHHIAAEKFREVLRHMNARYVYGLSATPRRADGLERIVFAECGNTLFTYDAAKLAYSRGLAQYFIPRFLHTVLSDSHKHISFTEILNDIAIDKERNAIIAEDIAKAFYNGRFILVLTRRIEQNKEIGKYLWQRNISNIILSSTMKQKEINGILHELKSSANRTVLIATDKLLGEGIDIPLLDTLFLASPFMQESAIQQYAGRISRENEGKKNTLIYDYADFLIPRLSYMYLKRLSVYRKLGYVPLTETDKPNTEMLFDDISFIDTFISDIQNASKTIEIAASYIASSNITNRILNVLSEALTKNVTVTIIHNERTENSSGFQSMAKRIAEYGIKIESSNTVNNHAIIDGFICWYGDFSLLGQSIRTQQKEDRRSILRILNKDVVNCFKNNLL